MRRAKRDPFRAAQLAPLAPALKVVCASCGHASLMHDADRCVSHRCPCTGYVEA